MYKRQDPAARTLVGCWIQYAAPVELGGDFLFAHSGKAERKNEPYCFGGLRVDHKMIVICRVLFIAIRRETADILPGAAFLCKEMCIRDRAYGFIVCQPPRI